MQSTIKEISSHNSAGDLHPKLKWLMLARVAFTTLLLVATIYFQFTNNQPAAASLLTVFYLFIAAVFLLSLYYVGVFNRIKRHCFFTYVQITVDSFTVSLVVLITGGAYSLFSFLYLVVIIFASMILYMRGGLFLAAMSSLLYGALLAVQYYEWLPQFDIGDGSLDFFQVLNKFLITSTAFFAVAVLSGMLTEQNRKSQDELRIMETHVKRVEKMAYMGEMAAGLAHEIKNPLASLVGSIQMLKEELHHDSDHIRLMDIILRETDRLSTLVNDFLFFARPPVGKPEILNLKEAIEEITSLFERDINHSRRFEMKTDLSNNLSVVMDPTHLRQIIWNLLLNAAEAVHDNGVIEIHAVPIKNNEVSIYVKDNGCGISSEAVQTIFDPFFTTKPKGTGLGLSIVHRILEAYESRLDVQTIVGVGTTFSFPLKRSGRVS